jgi:hypothetical protein
MSTGIRLASKVFKQPAIRIFRNLSKPVLAGLINFYDFHKARRGDRFCLPVAEIAVITGR